MKQLLWDFWHDRTTAVSFIRALAIGVALFVVSNPESFPQWAKFLAPVMAGGSVLFTGVKKPAISQEEAKKLVHPLQDVHADVL